MNRILIGIALWMALAGRIQADDLRHYFVAPVTTALHRATVSSTADAYAVVNCNALSVDDDLDLSALDKESFVSALSNVNASRGPLLLVCRYQLSDSVPKELRKRINQHLKDLCFSAGCKNVIVSEMSTSEDWKEAYQRAHKFNQPDDAREPLIENEHVRVFPVRTQLSKFVHGDADCIVDVLHPIDGRMKEISLELESSIRRAVHHAQLAEKHTMRFKLSSTTAGTEVVESLFDARPAPKIQESDNADILKFFKARAAEYRPSPALKLAQELGFQKIEYTHSPGGGAPEKLVGAEAPNFKLARLSGDQLDLHDFIDGRPALITFWGLACAPCRQEAPSLTELYNKYGKEFSIVAVNGYNDDHEAVAKYVADESLTHPIVLQGQTISDDLYHVGAYPTTFWVDRNGTIVDYEVGFFSTKRLEDRIVNLLVR